MLKKLEDNLEPYCDKTNYVLRAILKILIFYFGMFETWNNSTFNDKQYITYNNKNTYYIIIDVACR